MLFPLGQPSVRPTVPANAAYTKPLCLSGTCWRRFWKKFHKNKPLDGKQNQRRQSSPHRDWQASHSNRRAWSYHARRFLRLSVTLQVLLKRPVSRHAQTLATAVATSVIRRVKTRRIVFSCHRWRRNLWRWRTMFAKSFHQSIQKHLRNSMEHHGGNKPIRSTKPLTAFAKRSKHIHCGH